MSSHAARTLAGAIRRGAQRHDERHGPGVYRATITSVSPLGADLLGVDLSLDSDDIELSAVVEAYATDPGFVAGDILVLLEVDEGDFVATAVISDT